MNIGFITPRYSKNFWNGIGRCSYTMAQGLKNLGHSVTVFTYNSSPVTKKYRDDGVDVSNLGGISSNQSKFGIMFEDVDAWNDALDQELKGGEFNLLICFDWTGFEACWKYGERHNIAVVGLVGLLANGRGQYAPFSDPTKVKEFLEYEKVFLDQCDLLVAFNSGSEAEVKNLVKTPVKVLKLSVEPYELETKPDNGSVFIQGRIARERSLERAIRAAAELTWVTLNICGPGLDTHYGTYIKSLIQRPSIAIKDRVNFIGWVVDEKVPQYYSTAEIVLCTNSYDPFGYSALDAMAFGVPVIGCYESYRGVIEHDKTGLIFQNLESLKEQLAMLHKDKDLRTKLIANGKDYVAKENTVTKSVESFHSMLLEAVRVHAT